MGQGHSSGGSEYKNLIETLINSKDASMMRGAPITRAILSAASRKTTLDNDDSQPKARTPSDSP